MSRKRRTIGWRTWGTPTLVVVATMAVAGLLLRLVPLFEGDDMLFRQPTEDGYLLLTVARNLAIGRGLSTAEGTIATNGVQPLITLIFSAGYYLVGGDKVEGVRFAMLVSTVISLWAAWTIYAFGRRLLIERDFGERAAVLAAALWFASPISIRHATNALETGLYVALIFVVLERFIDLRQRVPQNRRLGSMMVLGMWIGACFWARNDGVFLALAVCGWWFVEAWRRGDHRAAWLQPLTIGGVAAIVALPWVLFNVVNFGHPVPVSGRSEGAGAVFAGNLDKLWATLAENALIVAGIPGELETNVFVQLGSVVVLVVALVGFVRCFRAAHAVEREVLLVAGAFTLALAGYYGLIFGAKHFLARYQAPVAPAWALLTVVCVRGAAIELATRWARPPLARVGMVVTGVVAVSLVVVQDVRLFFHRDDHDHMQVVYWIRDHVPDHAWVGAVQTGTIGYFHERSLNLDGKVNPAALEARRQRRVHDYVIESPIDYVADWAPMAFWDEQLKGHFRRLVHDPERNLGVLERVEKRSAGEP